MKKVLFVGIDNFFRGMIVRCTQSYGKDGIFFTANTIQDVDKECLDNPDIKLVILVGYLYNIPFDAHAPNTQKVVAKIRENLGDGVKILTASPEEKFNTILMKLGCDEKVPLEKLSERLSELL